MTITSVTLLSVQTNIRHVRKKMPRNNGAKVGISYMQGYFNTFCTDKSNRTPESEKPLSVKAQGLSH